MLDNSGEWIRAYLHPLGFLALYVDFKISAKNKGLMTTNDDIRLERKADSNLSMASWDNISSFIHKDKIKHKPFLSNQAFLYLFYSLVMDAELSK